MSGPVLRHLNLVVADMDAALTFYRRLGLDAPADAAAASGGHHAEVELPNGFVLELDTAPLVKGYNAGWRGPGAGGCLLGFSLPSREAVDALHDELVDAGHPSSQTPYDAFWGARYAVVEDPDGNPVGLMSPLDPDRQSAPPGFAVGRGAGAA